jgi:hypothetical protein
MYDEEIKEATIGKYVVCSETFIRSDCKRLDVFGSQGRHMLWGGGAIGETDWGRRWDRACGNKELWHSACDVGWVG